MIWMCHCRWNLTSYSCLQTQRSRRRQSVLSPTHFAPWLFSDYNKTQLSRLTPNHQRKDKYEPVRVPLRMRVGYTRRIEDNLRQLSIRVERRLPRMDSTSHAGSLAVSHPHQSGNCCNWSHSASSRFHANGRLPAAASGQCRVPVRGVGVGANSPLFAGRKHRLSCMWRPLKRRSLTTAVYAEEEHRCRVTVVQVPKYVIIHEGRVIKRLDDRESMKYIDGGEMTTAVWLAELMLMKRLRRRNRKYADNFRANELILVIVIVVGAKQTSVCRLSVVFLSG